MQTISFPSIKQFREIIRYMPMVSSIPYVGYPKIHGTNSSILFLNEEEFIPLSKNNPLSIGQDNFGFALWADQNKEAVQVFGNRLKSVTEILQYPFVVSGEWAGMGIQQGVGVSQVERFFSVFGVGNFIDGKYHWLADNYFRNVHDNTIRLFHISQFGEYRIDINPASPESSIEELCTYTESVEKECPVALFFGVSGVGEGVVWKPLVEEGYQADLSTTWFKVKGEKHTVTKVKKLVTVDPEVVNSMNEFVDKVVTVNRVKQGMQETQVTEMKDIGNLIKWVCNDILKEESDVITASNLEWKKVSSYVVRKIKQVFLEMV